jgi:hypothetical protein
MRQWAGGDPRPIRLPADLALPDSCTLLLWRPVRELNPSLRLDKPLSLPMNERA